MKKVCIGGILAVLGTMGFLACSLIAGAFPADSWYPDIGRFFSTLNEYSLTPVYILSIAELAAGLIVLVVAYFQKEA